MKFAFLLFATGLAFAAETYDVVVAGAGSGGVSAAIAAARMHRSVLLVEETDWIGGQMTAAAVPTMDEGHTNMESGIYREFIARVKEHYAALGKGVNTCYWRVDSNCFEPKVGQKVLYDMMADARKSGRLDVRLRTRITRVAVENERIAGVTLGNGAQVACKALIDATEYGDVLPLTPAAYREGKYRNGAVDGGGCVQSITYCAVIRKYANGVPEALRVKHAPPGYTEQVRAKFRKGLRADGNPKDRITPVNWGIHNAYRGLPDSNTQANYNSTQPEAITKTVVNWFNDFVVSIAGMNGAQRKRTFCEAKLHTLQFLYYMQNEMGQRDWAIADDEGYDTAYNREENSCDNIPAEFKAIERHFPPIPYIRESRRVVGLHTLTALELRREGTPGLAAVSFPNSIAIGDYAVDLHGCGSDETLEQEFEHSGDRPTRTRYGMFQIPLESLIAEGVDGLLGAEKNISQTRLANGATRLQPITMLTGQAAGLLAAMAIERNIAPRRVPAVDVQHALLAAGCALSLQRFSDIPRGHALWEAVELAATREWIAPAPKDVFNADEALSRLAAAATLARWSGAIKGFDRYAGSGLDKPTFTDVPVYNRYSAAVEALARKGAIAACGNSAQHFCPGDRMSAADFARAIAKLTGRDVKAPEGPLTRGQAVKMLFDATRK